MSILDLITNTIEGAAQVAVNVMKAPIGIVVSPVDDGKTALDAVGGLVDGLSKIGRAEREEA